MMSIDMNRELEIQEALDLCHKIREALRPIWGVQCVLPDQHSKSMTCYQVLDAIAQLINSLKAEPEEQSA